MEKLLELMKQLEDKLDKEPKILETKEVLSKIYADKQLLALIEEYKLSRKEELKYEIYKNVNFKRYKELENDINIIILQINQKLKNITSKGKCNK